MRDRIVLLIADPRGPALKAALDADRGEAVAVQRISHSVELKADRPAAVKCAAGPLYFARETA
jgi:hypothetical protein